MLLCNTIRTSNVQGPGWLNELGSWITYNSYKPITNTAWVRARLCKLQKRMHSTRSASDKVYQLLYGRHDIAEVLLKVALSTNKSINQIKCANYGIVISYYLYSQENRFNIRIVVVYNCYRLNSLHYFHFFLRPFDLIVLKDLYIIWMFNPCNY